LECFHSDGYEEYYLLVWNYVYSTDVSEERTVAIFKVEDLAKQETSKKEATLNMEVVRSSETSVDFTELHSVNVPEGSTLLVVLYLALTSEIVYRERRLSQQKLQEDITQEILQSLAMSIRCVTKPELLRY
jgi:hypothetical protein